MRSAVVPGRPGDDYWLTLDGKRYPDPASRWQPKGLRGPSRVVDHQGFSWTDDGFEAVPLREARALRAARRHLHAPRAPSTRSIPHLDALRDLGITAIELMPVAEFPGRTAGATTASTRSAAHSRLRRPRGPAAARRRRATARAWPSSSTSSTTTSAPTGERLRRGSAPTSPSKYATFWGPRDQLRRRRLRPGPRVGARRTRRMGPRLPARRPAPRRDPTRSTTRRPRTSCPRSPSGCTQARPARWSSPRSA